MTLSCGQTRADREAAPVDERVDFGREPASGTTRDNDLDPFLAVAACWRGRDSHHYVTRGVFGKFIRTFAETTGSRPTGS